MFKQHFFTLSNGNKIPGPSTIGAGSIYYKPDESTYKPELTKFLEKSFQELKGVIHVDAADFYNTYPETGDAFKANFKNGWKKREDLWCTDKFDSNCGKTPSSKVHVDKVLDRLGLGYIDLYLIHHPIVSEKLNLDVVEIWNQFIELQKEGKVKNIGVSNFSVKDIENLVEKTGVKPVVNQIEWNPFNFNQSPGIYHYCQKNDILIEAYASLTPLVNVLNGSDTTQAGTDFKAYLDELSKKYNVTNTVILLAYTIAMNVLPVTTSGKFERIQDAQNFVNDHPDLKLTKEEVDHVTELGLKHDTSRKYQFWTDHYTQFENESQKI